MSKVKRVLKFPPVTETLVGAKKAKTVSSIEASEESPVDPLVELPIKTAPDNKNGDLSTQESKSSEAVTQPSSRPLVFTYDEYNNGNPRYYKGDKKNANKGYYDGYIRVIWYCDSSKRSLYIDGDYASSLNQQDAEKLLRDHFDYPTGPMELIDGSTNAGIWKSGRVDGKVAGFLMRKRHYAPVPDTDDEASTTTEKKGKVSSEPTVLPQAIAIVASSSNTTDSKTETKRQSDDGDSDDSDDDIGYGGGVDVGVGDDVKSNDGDYEHTRIHYLTSCERLLGCTIESARDAVSRVALPKRDCYRCNKGTTDYVICSLPPVEDRHPVDLPTRFLYGNFTGSHVVCDNCLFYVNCGASLDFEFPGCGEDDPTCGRCDLRRPDCLISESKYINEEYKLCILCKYEEECNMECDVCEGQVSGLLMRRIVNDSNDDIHLICPICIQATDLVHAEQWEYIKPQYRPTAPGAPTPPVTTGGSLASVI